MMMIMKTIPISLIQSKSKVERFEMIRVNKNLYPIFYQDDDDYEDNDNDDDKLHRFPHRELSHLLSR